MKDFLDLLLNSFAFPIAGGVLLIFVLVMSFHLIGPTEVGLVLKRLGRRLRNDDPVAFDGEAGYQGELLMPGLRFRFWPVFVVTRHRWVQVPAGQIGVVIAQIGRALPIGAKSAVYKPEFGNYCNISAFLKAGGQKGVQRPVLPPGTLAPIHPVAFLVLTKDENFGHPISTDMKEIEAQIDRRNLVVTVIRPTKDDIDVCGVVTTLEGLPVDSGDIASRLGGFHDVVEMEHATRTNAEIIERLFGTKNEIHNNYQDFQAFLDGGGRIGLQHDPLVAGAYTLNPFLVKVEIVPMLVVEQGEVATMKAYIGLPTVDTSGPLFKHGSLVKPGHRGLWEEPLRTGKYAINPRLYTAIKVPTAILVLSWADYTSAAHMLDKDLKSIDAKSKEGFDFSIDLQVQLHVPDTKAPRVISRVGSMQNLVNELLQGAVGNHFRNKLQGMAAVDFIERRGMVQAEAEGHVRTLLESYEVDTYGVLIQDVRLPAELTKVLKDREIAHQEVATYEMKKLAEEKRREVERATGEANMQPDLVKARLGVDIQKDRAESRKAEAEGEAYYLAETGKASAVKTEAEGLALARGYSAQREALGEANAALTAIARVLVDSRQPIVPMISGGGDSGGMTNGLIGYLLSRELGKVEPKTANSNGAPHAH